MTWNLSASKFAATLKANAVMDDKLRKRNGLQISALLIRVRCSDLHSTRYFPIWTKQAPLNMSFLIEGSRGRKTWP